MIARPSKRSRYRRLRKGAAALEFVIVSLIFVSAVLGLVELSRAIMVRQVLVNSAREGARRAVVPGATDADLTASVSNGDATDGVVTWYLKNAGIPGTFTAKTYVNDTEAALSTASTRDRIGVEVGIPFSDVSWGFMRYMPVDATLSARVEMRKE